MTYSATGCEFDVHETAWSLQTREEDILCSVGQAALERANVTSTAYEEATERVRR